MVGGEEEDRESVREHTRQVGWTRQAAGLDEVKGPILELHVRETRIRYSLPMRGFHPRKSCARVDIPFLIFLVLLTRHLR